MEMNTLNEFKINFFFVKINMKVHVYTHKYCNKRSQRQLKIIEQSQS